ncbi:hypothetical protein EB241_03780 [Erwinia psidii]|uniref:Uncharacterized protein n=1 Tax=Erwinia psidii TaxID=69224 RepID=A0A3N6S3W1_9GAMM|nr:hypothetical protein EB241_03780 [Erwinia psidii]
MINPQRTEQSRTALTQLASTCQPQHQRRQYPLYRKDPYRTDWLTGFMDRPCGKPGLRTAPTIAAVPARL